MISQRADRARGTTIATRGADYFGLRGTYRTIKIARRKVLIVAPERLAIYEETMPRGRPARADLVWLDEDRRLQLLDALEKVARA